jgi:hypothetical protein
MLREFQNTVKYHEESLKKLEVPILQPPCLPNWEYASVHFPHCRANVNPVRWDLVGIVEAGSIGIMSVDS